MSKYKAVPVDLPMDMVRAFAVTANPDEKWGEAPDAEKRVVAERLSECYIAMLDASPDIGMVVVPRDLLERLYHGWNSSADVFGPMQELRTIMEKAND